MLRDRVLEQEQQLSMLQQRASQCEQLEREARQAAELGHTASKESKVRGGWRWERGEGGREGNRR